VSNDGKSGNVKKDEVANFFPARIVKKTYNYGIHELPMIS